MTESERYEYATHVGNDTTGAQGLQIALQEIETHIWELEHADETGITPEYIILTQQEVVNYLKQLVSTLGNPGTTKLQKTYWKGYIQKAKDLVTNCKTKLDNMMSLWNSADKKNGEEKTKEMMTINFSIKI